MSSDTWGAYTEAQHHGELGEDAHKHRRYVEAIDNYRVAAEGFEQISEFRQAGSYYKLLGDTQMEYYRAIRSGAVPITDSRGCACTSKRERKRMVITSIYEAEDSYRLARLAFEEGGYRSHARSVYILEKETQRQIAWRSKKGIREGVSLSSKDWIIRETSWPFLTVLKYTCNYGESVSRFIILTLAVIISFAIAYYPNPWGWGFIELKGVVWSSSFPSFENSIAAGYFSVITFVTLGYGDIHPANTAARIATCLEVIFGYVMFGTLLVLVVRKLTYT